MTKTKGAPKMFIESLSWQDMDKTTVSLKTLIEEYITTCRLEGKSPKTIRGYREKLFRFVRTVNGTLADFNLSTVRSYTATLQNTKK